MEISNNSLFSYQDKDKINRALTGRRLEPMAVQLKKSDLTTSPLD
jgi:hypothetical protein